MKKSEERFVTMATLHRDVGNESGRDGNWETIAWLAAHVGLLVNRVSELEKKLKHLKGGK